MDSSIIQQADYVDENVNSHPNSPIPKEGLKNFNQENQSIPKSKTDRIVEISTLNDGLESEISPHRINIKERYAYAMKQQEKREKERLNKIKHDPRSSIQPELDNHQNGQSMYQSPTQKDFSNKFRQGLATPNMLWSDAVRKLQEKQVQRHELVRSSTQDFAKEIDNFQVASKRIHEWEENVLYDPTAIELSVTWQKIRGYLQLSFEEQHAYIQDVSETQAMLVGSVKVMGCDDFPHESMEFLQKQLDFRTKYLGLRTSIHAINNTNATITVPLKIIAMICRINPREKELALFVVAHVQPGYTEDDVATIFNTALALKVYAPSATANSADSSSSKNTNNRFLLVQKNIHMLSSASQLAFQDVLIEDFPISDIYEDEFTNPNAPISSSMSAEIQHMIESNGQEFCSPEVRAMTRKLSMGVRADYQEYPATPLPPPVASAILDLDDISPCKAQENEERGLLSSTFSSPYHTVEGELPSSVSPMIEYSTPKKAWIAPAGGVSPLPPPSNSDTDNNFIEKFNEHEHAHSAIDASLATNATVPSQAFISLDLQQVDRVSCTDKIFIAQQRGASSAASCSTIMINHALKSNTFAETQSLAVDNRVFELSRGIALSGFISKLPTRSLGWGQLSRRFFVLKDTTLSYFTTKPAVTDVFAPELSPKRTFSITEHTKIEIVYLGGIRRCVRIIFPETGQSLYWSLKQEKEARWIQAISQAIASQRKKHENTLSILSLKTWWFHEGNDFQLVAYDIAPITTGLPTQYVRVALFRTNRIYFCDIITPNQEKMQVELIRTNEQPLLNKSAENTDGIDLRTVKIYGDKLLLGGSSSSSSNSIMFIAMLGRTTGVSIVESGRKVLYCVPMTPPAAASAAKTTAKSNKIRHLHSKKTSSDYSDDDEDEDVEYAETAGQTNSRKPRRLHRQQQSQQQQPSASNSRPMAMLTKETCWDMFACEERMHVFVAIDRLHNHLCFYQCDLPAIPSTLANTATNNTNSATQLLLDSPSKKRPGFYYHIKPEYQSSFALSSIPNGSAAIKEGQEERVLHAQFLSEYSAGHLLVSTTQRLLLLQVTAQEKSIGSMIFTVSSYVVLDSVDISAGQIGAFAVQATSTSPSTGSVTSTGIMSKSSSSIQSSSLDLHQTQPQKMVVWRLVQEVRHHLSEESGPVDSLRLCYVVRREIEREQIQELLCHATPI